MIAGYKEAICVKAYVKPSSSSYSSYPIYSYTNIYVRQCANTCECALSRKSISSTYYKYVTGGTTTLTHANYEVIFTHTKKSECPVTLCTKYKSDCSSDLGDDNDIVIGSDPNYSISGKVNSANGYNHNFCYKCTVTQTAGGVAFTFTNTMWIRQYADCSN